MQRAVSIRERRSATHHDRTAVAATLAEVEESVRW